MLAPKPRDFTRSPDLGRARILKALREGIPGTAMKRFAGTLTADEIEAVAAFVQDEFVRRQAPNTAYHIAANGWPDHQARYGLAYPFVRGELSLDQPVGELSPDQQRGRQLTIDACITCHEPRTASAPWESFPLSHMGEVIRDPVDLVSRPSVYGMHDRPFEVAGLTAAEQQGKELYDANCAFCHARDGTGKNWIGAFLEPHPRNLTDPAQTAHLGPERLRTVIREGLPGTSMPAWGAVLDDAQVNAVIAYVTRAFLGNKRVQDLHTGGNEQP